MQIQNNIASVNSSRNQKIIKGKLDKSLEKLSSGFRINRAGDDAAGLAISELMRSQIRGLDQAMRNVNDGVSMTNTGEGALTEIHSMLQRMKTLAVQSANGTYSSVARENIESERLQLLDEIDRISQTTDFDGIPLFKEYPGNLPPRICTPGKGRRNNPPDRALRSRDPGCGTVLYGKQGASFKGYGFHHGG